MKKNAQVWIETVLYTLIGLALIGAALGFIMPKINESRDKVSVEQAVNSLSILDEKITQTMDSGAGNRREYDFTMKKGEFYINSINNNVTFALSGFSKPYSEPNSEISIGRVSLITKQVQNGYAVYLTLNYHADIVYKWKDENQKFGPASTPYKFLIENNGTVIDIESTS